jgi:hypothetical protein
MKLLPEWSFARSDQLDLFLCQPVQLNCKLIDLRIGGLDLPAQSRPFYSLPVSWIMIYLCKFF